MALTELAHNLIRRHFELSSNAQNLAVDATCGNGHDTLFLAEQGFKKVIGLDIQASAIEISRKRLSAANFQNVQLRQLGHQYLASIIYQPIDCIMFNLGYLPNADKRITTRADTSLTALNIALALLSPNAIASIICYPGHQSGGQETAAIKAWLATLGTGWKIATHYSTTPKTTAPILTLIQKSPAALNARY